MEVEKRGPKGGFLQLFDWNVKSRKKLFSNKSELSEGSNSGKEKFNCSAMSQVQQVQERGPAVTIQGSRAYNSVASMNDDDDGYGTRAPGVVARLMGLDSLPTSNASEICFDPSSFRGFHSERIVSTFQDEHIIDYSSSMMHHNVASFARNPIEPRQPKMQIRPMERFQTEVLPPKSAKSIPSTHHRHLSPIKSPGFVPTRTAAYIMEAAAKIIDQSPQSIAKSKVPFFGSPSVPLRIRDLKEKMAATQIPSRLPETSRRPKRPSSVKASLDSENRSSDNSKSKGKSVSLAIQAKANVQKKDVSTSGINRNSVNQRQNNEVKSGRSDKTQSNAVQNVQKKTLTTTSKSQNVLRQNNQKQNYASDRDKQPKKALPADGSSGPSKTLNKAVANSVSGTRKAQPKEYLSSKSKNLSRKKQPANRNLQFDDNSNKTDLPSSKNERSVKCNVTTDGCVNWDAIDRKSSMDVVSFTFTSPIKRSAPGSQSSSRGEYNEGFCFNPLNVQFDMDKTTLSSVGLSGIGAENLSVLLEQKLKELTCRVELSPSYRSSLLIEHDKTFQPGFQKDESDSPRDRLLLKTKRKSQGLEEAMERNNNNYEYREEHDFRSPSSSSVEPSSVSDGSLTSSGQSSYGGNNCLSFDPRGIFNYQSSKNPQGVEFEAELSDSASSLSLGIIERRDITNTYSIMDDQNSSNWELEYVRDILSNAELSFDDFALCEVHKFMTFDLFDRLEDQKTTSADKNIEEFSKLGRKLVFDSVIECLGIKSEQLCGGSGKAWAKWSMLFQRKGRLAEELYKEISGWAIMGDLMVDELVDMDMSTKTGKWVDFEIEAFECSIEIENGIVNSLIDELVADFSL